MALSERDLAVLAMERRTFRRRGAKEQAVRDELDLSATRYYQVLNALLDDPGALAADPLLVGRLRRLREERTAGRDLTVPDGAAAAPDTLARTAARTAAGDGDDAPARPGNPARRGGPARTVEE